VAWPPRLVTPGSSRTFCAAVALGLALVPREATADERHGLRWAGDARIATSTRGAVLFGPALRFRYGVGITRQAPGDDSARDRLVGSFAGGELSAGLLVGGTERDRYGALTLLAFRPWLSRHQSEWFLGTERWSVLGALLPEVGVTFGMKEVPRLHLGWDIALGPRPFQIVPGVVWVSPGHRLPVLFTLAFRVPM
jgi:hypothetical protein